MYVCVRVYLPLPRLPITTHPPARVSVGIWRSFFSDLLSASRDTKERTVFLSGTSSPISAGCASGCEEGGVVQGVNVKSLLPPQLWGGRLPRGPWRGCVGPWSPWKRRIQSQQTAVRANGSAWAGGARPLQSALSRAGFSWLCGLGAVSLNLSGREEGPGAGRSQLRLIAFHRYSDQGGLGAPGREWKKGPGGSWAPWGPSLPPWPPSRAAAGSLSHTPSCCPP